MTSSPRLVSISLFAAIGLLSAVNVEARQSLLSHTCPGGAVAPGKSTGTVVGGREYTLHVPTGYDPHQPMPVVLNLHGWNDTPDIQDSLSKFPELGEHKRFLVVTPAASPSFLGILWNALPPGPFNWPSTFLPWDDVAFIRDVLDDVSNTVCVDPGRVYATGYSMGAVMAHKLGCELSDRIAAIAPVAGQNLADWTMPVLQPCTPARPVPVFYVHGTADTILYYGGCEANPEFGCFFPFAPPYPSAPLTAANWVARNQCDAKHSKVWTNGDVSCRNWKHCAEDAEVTFCTVSGGGHTWPGSVDHSQPAYEALYGPTTFNLDATEEIWDFFSKHKIEFD